MYSRQDTDTRLQQQAAAETPRPALLAPRQVTVDDRICM